MLVPDLIQSRKRVDRFTEIAVASDHPKRLDHRFRRHDLRESLVAVKPLRCQFPASLSLDASAAKEVHVSSLCRTEVLIVDLQREPAESCTDRDAVFGRVV